MSGAAGVDSAYAPSPEQAAQARTDGIVWWGCYLAGTAALNVWTPAEIAVLKDAGIAPLPICVPAQNFAESPAQVASTMLAALAAAGIVSGGVVLDVEHSANGAAWPGFWTVWAEHLAAAGYRPVLYNGPHAAMPQPTWEPHEGPPPGGGAVQFGSTTISGLAVDTDQADEAFPLGSFDAPEPDPGPPAPEPAPSAPPTPLEDRNMYIYEVTSDGTKTGTPVGFGVVPTTGKPFLIPTGSESAGDALGIANSISDQIPGVATVEGSGGVPMRLLSQATWDAWVNAA